MTSHVPPLVMENGVTARRPRVLRLALLAVALLFSVGLFARIMTFPLNHDEQIHVTAAALLFRQPLYGALGYNHLPGLPLLLGGLYRLTAAEHLLTVGRLLIVSCWIATGAILSLIAWRQTQDARIAVIAILVLAAGTLLGPAGMLVTNNFLPVPFALLGFHLFVTALEGEQISRRMLLGAGAAIGFAIALKVSFVFLVLPFAVAATLVRPGLPVEGRMREVMLPFVLGGAVGCAPALIVLADGPQNLFAHTVRYFTAGHLTYWELSDEPKAMSLAAKILVAEDVWLSGSGLLAALLVVGSIWLLGERSRQTLSTMPILLAATLVLCGAALSFLPTPAFPQYYEPPVPFVIVLFILIYARLDQDERGRMQPMLGAVAMLALAIILPRLAPTLVDVVRPGRWTGNVIHAEGMRIKAALSPGAGKGKVATLAPIIALEARLPIYRAFGAGPFLYRVAEFLPAEDRRWFTTTSPRDLARFLDADPPSAIVVGREPRLDLAFIEYARGRHYRPVPTDDPRFGLFVRP